MVAKSISQTCQFAENVVSLLRKADFVNDRATILALSGPLGAGKTALVKCIAECLGVLDVVTSPTFLLRADYHTKDEVFSTLIHIDGYRFEHPDESSTIGWSDVLTSPNTLVAVEWAERFGSHFPKESCKITAAVDGDEHTFTLSKTV